MTALTALEHAPLKRCDRFVLGMAQLSLRGLSEDWWLRHLGDVHWQLIADAIGQETTDFRDADGRQIYAAFCATEFEQFAPDAAKLGGAVTVQSDLWAAGQHRLQSDHVVRSEGQVVARLRLVSTFVAHRKPGVNTSVSRTRPPFLPGLPQATDGFAKRSGRLARARRAEGAGPGKSILLRPNVGGDFNAVGLLYFPSYTRLFEQAEPHLASFAHWSPVRRRLVLYLGNIEVGEAVRASAAQDGPRSMMLWRAGGGGDAAGLLAHCTCHRF